MINPENTVPLAEGPLSGEVRNQKIAQGSVRTRERIIEQALVLFNEQGLGRTSLNQTALELGISSGNLHYHFKTRAHLISRLINRFDSEIQPLVDRHRGDIVGIDDFWLYIHLLLEVCLRYRFILRDVDQILTECNDAISRLTRIRSNIESKMLDCCLKMRARGILIIQPDEIDSLALHLAFVICCWPAFDLLSGNTGTAKTRPENAAYQALSLLAPFLDSREKGYLEYLRNKYASRSTATSSSESTPRAQ